MYEFDFEWVPGIYNYLADALTRDMNKAHIHPCSSRRTDIFSLPGKNSKDDSFETFVKRFHILELVLGDLVVEIKKIVGLRIRRNHWIQICQAWKFKNVGILLGLDEELVKVYPLPNMKVKLYFKTLDDYWSREYTKDMIQVLQTLNYYQIIGGIDFSLAVYTSAKMLDLDEINMNEGVQRFLTSLRIPDLFEEIDAAFLQRNDENYVGTDSFPQYELFEPFADWEIKNGRCTKKPQVRASQCVEITLQYLRTFSTPWDYQSLEFINPIVPNPFAQIYGPERLDESILADNTEEVKKITLWLK